MQSRFKFKNEVFRKPDPDVRPGDFSEVKNRIGSNILMK